MIYKHCENTLLLATSTTWTKDWLDSRSPVGWGAVWRVACRDDKPIVCLLLQISRLKTNSFFYQEKLVKTVKTLNNNKSVSHCMWCELLFVCLCCVRSVCADEKKEEGGQAAAWFIPSKMNFPFYSHPCCFTSHGTLRGHTKRRINLPPNGKPVHSPDQSRPHSLGEVLVWGGWGQQIPDQSLTWNWIRLKSSSLMRRRKVLSDKKEPQGVRANMRFYQSLSE